MRQARKPKPTNKGQAFDAAVRAALARCPDERLRQLILKSAAASARHPSGVSPQDRQAICAGVGWVPGDTTPEGAS